MQQPETIRKAEKALELINGGMGKKEAVKKAGLAYSGFHIYMKRKAGFPAKISSRVPRSKKPVVTFPVLDVNEGSITMTHAGFAAFVKELIRA